MNRARPHARPQASVLCRGGGSLSSRGSHSKGGVGVACGWWLGICYCNRPTSRAGPRDRPTHFLPGLPSARSAAPRRLSGTHRHAHQWRMGRMDPSMQFHATHTARGIPHQNPIVRACSARRSARPRGVKTARTRRHAAHWASPDRPAASRGHVKRFVSSARALHIDRASPTMPTKAAVTDPPPRTPRQNEKQLPCSLLFRPKCPKC